MCNGRTASFHQKLENPVENVIISFAAEKFFSGSPGGQIRVSIFFVISKASTIVEIGTAPGLLSLVVDFCRHWTSAAAKEL